MPEESYSEKFVHPKGYFGKVSGADKIQWKEISPFTSAVYQFEEASRTNGMILLKDAPRNIWVQLPVEGGTSKLSTDGGKTWAGFYEVKKTEN